MEIITKDEKEFNHIIEQIKNDKDKKKRVKKIKKLFNETDEELNNEKH